jgi:hypothetical protein
LVAILVDLDLLLEFPRYLEDLAHVILTLTVEVEGAVP